MEEEEFQKGLSLRIKLGIGLILIIGILVTGHDAVSLYQHRQRLQNQVRKANLMAATLMAGPLSSELGNYDLRSGRIKAFLDNFLNAAFVLNRANTELAFVVVTDANDQVVAGRARTKETVFPGPKIYANEQVAVQQVAKLKGALGGNMRTVRFPLQVKGKGQVGTLMVGTNSAHIKRQLQRDLQVSIGLLAGTLVVLVLYAFWALGRMVIRPLNNVVAAMTSVREGYLDQEIEETRRDELGQLANTFNFMVRGLKDRERLKDAFSRYLSKQVYEKFQRGEVALAGETRHATVLFSDIRSFTALSEQLTPEQVVAMLNEYFTEMVEVVLKYDGFLNKFIGDAIMAIYNVPLNQDEPELRAVRTAVEMVQALEQLNVRRKERGEPELKVGIGVNTGPVVAGNLGHEQRLEYTVIGDTVNLAQRIESQTKIAGHSVLISQATYDAVQHSVDADPLPPVKVKGKQDLVQLYAVHGVK